MQKFSYLNSSNADYIDELFTRYLKDPNSVDETWRYFFEGVEWGGTEFPAEPEHTNGNGNGSAGPPMPAPMIATTVGAEANVAELIQAYRVMGKFLADINPLSPPPSSHPSLELSRFGLSNADLGKKFSAGRLIGLESATLQQIVEKLKATYCGTVAVEVAYITDPVEREWLTKKVEAARAKLDAETRKFILKRISESEGFERFLHTRYVAQKRFSVEGGEAVIPGLDAMIETAAELGATDFVVGMAHRGRLNVLRHIFGKPAEQLFVEFEGTYKIDQGEGDVKYHKGASKDDVTRKGKKVHLSLGWNPSHLEFINPVVEGMVRAKQEMRGDKDRSTVVPIQIHGDAAFAGQGVCYETIQMSQLKGYSTGGTLHIVINNQVGFTTSPIDSRSTQYCTDMAKMLDAPIFHVNGDDAEAMWFISQLCAEYRQKFKKDAFVDLVCYRKHGHNEGDEPSFTQPLLYKKIKGHESPRDVYAKRLVAEGTLTEAQAQAIVDQINEAHMKAQQVAKAENPHPHVSVFEGKWKGLRSPSEEDLFKTVNTAVGEKALKEIAAKINAIPAGFHLHPKLARFFEARAKAVQDGKGIDWGNGEALAYATLLAEGHPVRITGQDAERGTFTHRHSVLNDFETGETYVPFNHISPKQAFYQVHNSHLSETGVMGFEYGYSLADPNSLVIWEAQFGDFANGAQVIIDQFVSTSESKWQRYTGLVLLLPHGYEGQGPEHSSARLERFLQLCGRDNMTVANFTTPAQLFHGMRRQLKREFRKPLVIMSPKSLLRHPQAISTLDEFTKGQFQEVIGDSEIDAKKVKRVLLCSGKVYYDLLADRTARKRDDVAIVRVEQLYPWPADALAKTLKSFTAAHDYVWVQEEPRNMGAWSFVFNHWAGGLADFSKQVGGKMVRYAGRGIAASPAVGSPKVHDKEQKALIEEAFQA